METGSMILEKSLAMTGEVIDDRPSGKEARDNVVSLSRQGCRLSTTRKGD